MAARWVRMTSHTGVCQSQSQKHSGDETKQIISGKPLRKCD
jgi:hypothetical protein